MPALLPVRLVAEAHQPPVPLPAAAKPRWAKQNLRGRFPVKNSALTGDGWGANRVLQCTIIVEGGEEAMAAVDFGMRAQKRPDLWVADHLVENCEVRCRQGRGRATVCRRLPMVPTPLCAWLAAICAVVLAPALASRALHLAPLRRRAPNTRHFRRMAGLPPGFWDLPAPPPLPVLRAHLLCIVQVRTMGVVTIPVYEPRSAGARFP